MSESLFQDQSLLDNEEGGDAKKEGRMLSKCDERVEGKKKSCENAVSAEIPSEGLKQENSHEDGNTEMRQLTPEEEEQLREAIRRNRVPSLHAERILSSYFRRLFYCALMHRSF